MNKMDKAIATLISTSMLSLLRISPVFAQVATLEFDYDTPKDSGKIQSQGVQASLSYSKSEEDGYTEYTPNLTITARDQVIEVTGESSFLKYSMVQIAEMDQSNPFPEVIFSSFTGGAHCCTAVKILTSNADGSEWETVDFGAFDGGMNEVSDPDQTGVYKYVTRDNNFLYLYSSYAGSFPPIQVWQLDGLKMINISQEPQFFPLHRQQLQEMWQMIKEAEKEDYEVNGVLAGYVATKAILGEEKSAWELMLKRYDASSDWSLEYCNGGYSDQGECLGDLMTYDSFPDALKAFLIETDYLKAGDIP